MRPSLPQASFERDELKLIVIFLNTTERDIAELQGWLHSAIIREAKSLYAEKRKPSLEALPHKTGRNGRFK